MCGSISDGLEYFFKRSASVTSFILMAWNSSKLVNTARGCLPWKVWICNCWRQGWKAGDCFSVVKSCVLPWASASPDAGGGTLSWVHSMENRTAKEERRSSLSLPLEGVPGREFVSLCPSSPCRQALGTQPLAAAPAVTLCCGVSGPFYSYLIILRWPEVCDLCLHVSAGHVACGDGHDPARSSPSYQEQKQDVSC